MQTRKKLNYDNLTPEQKNIIENNIDAKGGFIDLMVDIEMRMESIILYFLDAYEKKSIYNFLHHFLFQKGSFNTELKVDSIQQIIKIENTKVKSHPEILKLIRKFIELRNILAHYPAVLIKSGTFTYGKPDFNADGKEWEPQLRIIAISQEKSVQLRIQSKIALTYLEYIEDCFHKNDSELNFNPPYKRMEELFKTYSKELLTKPHGIFGINLKE